MKIGKKEILFMIKFFGIFAVFEFFILPNEILFLQEFITSVQAGIFDLER